LSGDLVAAPADTPAASSPPSISGAAASATSQTLAAPAPAAPSATVDTRAANWQQAFASRVQWLVDHDVGEAHIKLNPPELGAVDVKISLVEDKTFVHLTAASATARDELTQALPRLRELLTASGLEFGGASVHGGTDGRGHQEPGGRAVAGPLAELDAVQADGVPLRPTTLAAGRIDLFA
jgi:flagellar hook-length control protein FliK